MAQDASYPIDPTIVRAVHSAVQERFSRAQQQLMDLARIPGVVWEGHDSSHLERSAEAVRDLFADAGAGELEILRAPTHEGVEGAPAFVGRCPAAPGQRRVLLYAHHDVQPPGDEHLWEGAPFEPREADGRLWGRGVADDKAGILVHVVAFEAARAVLGPDWGLGVSIFVEGEEEAGSPSFANFLDRYGDRLDADVIVVADSANWKVGVPALTTSLRGLVDGVIEVRVLDHAVHSGMFGGPILDAPTQLARLVATFHDEAGAVAIQGLTSAPDPEIDYPEADFIRDSGVLPGLQLAGRGSLAGRLWSQPALSVIGIDAPGVAESSNTVIPAARAKISLRLAPGQEPAEAQRALAEHITRHSTTGAQVTFIPGERGPSFTTDTSDQAAQFMLWALGQAWGTPPVEIGMGGSIPFIGHLVEKFPAAEILITGVEDPDTRAHSPNESVHVGDLQRAMVAEALLLIALHAQP